MTQKYGHAAARPATSRVLAVFFGIFWQPVSSRIPISVCQIKFVTRIYHPSVKSSGEDAGAVCVDLVNSRWAATSNIKDVLDLLVSIMKDPSTGACLFACNILG